MQSTRVYPRWIPIGALLTAAASVAFSASSSAGSVRTVFQFPNDTFVENLAVRSNGQILVSALNRPHLFLIDPQLDVPPTIVHTFETIGLAGIAEYEPDIFACITGNFSFATGDVGAGTWAVWSVDLRGVKLQPDKTLSPSPRVSKIASIPTAGILNGIALLSERQKTLLVGDIHDGNIIRLDVDTGSHVVVINNTFTESTPAPPFPRAGVDGLHIQDDILYFTNVGASAFYKVRICEGGTPVGSFETIAHTLGAPDQYDDFALDCKGNAFLVTGGGNSVEMVSFDGSRQVIIAGDLNSTAIAEPTSAAFGRGLFDRNVLYVTTAGGLVTPVDGDVVIGGQLVAVTTALTGLC